LFFYKYTQGPFMSTMLITATGGCAGAAIGYKLSDWFQTKEPGCTRDMRLVKQLSLAGAACGMAIGGAIALGMKGEMVASSAAFFGGLGIAAGAVVGIYLSNGHRDSTAPTLGVFGTCVLTGGNFGVVTGAAIAKIAGIASAMFVNALQEHACS
jgi:hypothetical protein